MGQACGVVVLVKFCVYAWRCVKNLITQATALPLIIESAVQGIPDPVTKEVKG